MPVVCRNRPNRTVPRKLNAKAAARLVCATLEELKPVPISRNVAALLRTTPEDLARQSGLRWTQADIEAELKARDCGWIVGGDPDCERKKEEAKAIALELVQGNNTTIAVADSVLFALEVAGRALLLFLRGAPGPLRAAAIPLQLANNRVGAVRTQLAARRAANDDLFRLVSGL